MNNFTSTSSFLLLEFSDMRELQILSFFVFLALYLTALIGNLLIVTVVAVDSHLHTPMYYFLFNLAMSDIGSISVMVPKAMAMSLKNDRSITYAGCVAQVFFHVFFATSGFSVLTIMAHDRYVAICHPLHYERIMHKGACLQMVAIGLIGSLIYTILHTGGTFGNTFCSNIVNQFFCEIPQLIKLSCSGISIMETGFLILAFSLALGYLIVIIRSYVQIFVVVLRIPSSQGQKKALSTCVPHLTVVTMFVASGVLVYARSTAQSSNLDSILSMIYTIIPPTSNPFIYSVRNKEVKTALQNLLRVAISYKNKFKVVL
ncbi:olfactory receptor 14C36-like [Anolis carolinensis]|uniref:olfactory receptor 14C36-like n=1 Tax=Anolis carolinensis TaxID=28377 RepID=UPI000203A2AD|nr:PREDICTED: olfactory receptor 14C36-like isoform X2 [Anolis carolinensis]|eukprot:XP_016851323.1 PREDICTED: olfactory receptor 14C36-like isoform X2 [Anolis carolinensis]